MFILKNEGATLNLKRSDLLKARAIQNQWLLPLERTKHQSPALALCPSHSCTKSQNQGHTNRPHALNGVPDPLCQDPSAFMTKSRGRHGRGAPLKKETGSCQCHSPALVEAQAARPRQGATFPQPPALECRHWRQLLGPEA